MKIKINGSEFLYPQKDASLEKVLLMFLSKDKVEQIRGVAVAINGELIRRGAWVNYKVQEGDELEVLTATQGG
jgi:sulfur carrier protein